MQLFKPFSRYAVHAAFLALTMAAAQAQQSGVWTNLAGGSWANSANWSAGAIANGTDATADFSQFTLGVAPTVTLDGAQSIGNLIFGDKGNTYGWKLNTGSGGPLTLSFSSASPVITVNGQTTTVGLVLDGTQGLAKVGAGTLVLTNANTFTGGLTLSNGVALEDFTSLSTPTDLINNGNALTNAGGFLIIKSSTSGATSQSFSRVSIRPGGGGILGNVNGGASTTINLGAGFTNSIAGGSLLIGSFGANNNGLIFTTTSKTNTQFPGSALVVNTYGPRIVYTSDNGTTVDWATTMSSGSPYAITNYTAYTTVSSSGVFTNWNTVGTNFSMAGGISVTSTVLTRPQTLKMFGGSSLDIGTNKMNIQNSGLLCVGSTACSISGGAAVASISGICGNFGNNPYDLVVQQYNTAGLNVGAGFCDPLASSGPLSLVKAGPGTLTLTGTNQYTGATYINAGTLTVAGAGQLSTNATVNYAGKIFNNSVFNYASSKAQILSGGISGIGSLTNAGPGTLTLTGTNTYTYTGSTTITGGTLALSGNGSLSNTAVITINGGTLALAGVTNVVGSPTSPIGKVNLTSATLQLPADANTTNICASSLNLADNNSVINVSALPTITANPSLFPLISYTSFSGGSINLGTLPSIYKGYLSNDMASLVIWLVVTNAPAKPVVWGGGVNNLWNTTTLNWTNAGVAVIYNENDFVTFDDLGKTNLVNLTSSHTPATLALTNNVLNYTFTGVGSIGGVVGLNKQGSASLTLAETGGDNFSGGIVVGGGTVVLDDANCAIFGGVSIASGATLQIGNNDTNGSLPTGTVDDQGTVAFKRTDNILLSRVIPGGGGLTQNGSGKLTLSATNTYTGNTTVLQGTLALGVAGAVNSSAQIDVSNGTLDLSAVTGSTTMSLLPPVTLTNAGLTVGAPYLKAGVNLTSLSVGGPANTINLSALPPMASYPVTVTLLQSASPISGNNFVLGSLPTASPAYGGTISISGDQTTLYLTVTNGPVGVRPQVYWTGNDTVVSSNWSDALNWQAPGAPTSGESVFFNDAGAVGAVSNINNIVNANTTIGSLTYGNTNNYHTTLINPGVTLAISNNAATNLVFVGTGKDNGLDQIVDVTMTGVGGSLAVVGTNVGAVFSVAQASTTAGSHAAILDLSGLDTFKLTAGRLLVAGDYASAVARAAGTLILAKTNVIRLNGAAPALCVGDDPGNGGGTFNSFQLGQTNSLFVDTMTIARTKMNGTCTLSFNPALAGNNPALYLRGNTTAQVSALAIGDDSAISGSGSSSIGTVDLSLGTVDALVNTCYVGRGQNGNGSGGGNGTLTLGAGVFNVNTLYVAYVSASTAVANTVGTVNVNASGTLVVNSTLALGVNPASTPTATATLNITNGTVLANSITSSVALVNSTINLVGGTLVISNTAGTSAAPLTTLALDGGTLQLNVNGNVSTTNIVAASVTTGATSTINIGSVANVSGTVQIPLISYTGTDPFSALNLGTYPAGYNATLVDNTGKNSIDLSLAPAIATNPTNITFNVSGHTLNLSWPLDHLGWLVQSNSANLAVPAYWYDIPSTAAGTNYSITIDATKANVFYRLRKP